MAKSISSRDRLATLDQPAPKIRARAALVGLILIALIIGLIISATVETGMYFLTVDEFQDRQSSLVGTRVRVNGMVVADSEEWDASQPRLVFAIQDEEGGPALPIVFHGPRPDNFARATSAIVEGTVSADGQFVADSLLLKCPSRYEEAPEEVFVTAA